MPPGITPFSTPAFGSISAAIFPLPPARARRSTRSTRPTRGAGADWSPMCRRGFPIQRSILAGSFAATKPVERRSDLTLGENTSNPPQLTITYQVPISISDADAISGDTDSNSHINSISNPDADSAESNAHGNSTFDADTNPAGSNSHGNSIVDADPNPAEHQRRLRLQARPQHQPTPTPTPQLQRPPQHQRQPQHRPRPHRLQRQLLPRQRLQHHPRRRQRPLALLETSRRVCAWKQATTF